MADFYYNGIELVQTCGACPEQYDAMRDGDVVGYFRLRHGHFTVNAYGPGGREVYEAQPEGDGIFAHHERDKFLREGIDALRGAIG